jgi:hypothetical protein
MELGREIAEGKVGEPPAPRIAEREPWPSGVAGVTPGFADPRTLEPPMAEREANGSRRCGARTPPNLGVTARPAEDEDPVGATEVEPRPALEEPPDP